MYTVRQIGTELVWMWFAYCRDYTIAAEVRGRQATNCHDESSSQVSSILSRTSRAWQFHISTYSCTVSLWYLWHAELCLWQFSANVNSLITVQCAYYYTAVWLCWLIFAASRSFYWWPYYNWMLRNELLNVTSHSVRHQLSTDWNEFWTGQSYLRVCQKDLVWQSAICITVQVQTVRCCWISGCL